MQLRALDALDDLLAICQPYPEAGAELAAALGDDVLREIAGARDTIARAVSRLQGESGGDTPTPG